MKISRGINISCDPPDSGLDALAGTLLLVAPRVVWGTRVVLELPPVAMAGICCGYTPSIVELARSAGAAASVLLAAYAPPPSCTPVV